ncbi:hypothetical protein GS399_11160 [Pedobacter sp. HMF7647]|uniref:Uncharacterized protein n=1 Tax=Hufsiella arboris TaxID=2695275 RepID=A0A7K1YAT0_9SPHI|nr:hypothetical protein [Hufsiella arboris]MXV51530.1 hypothetical protein [Hufsiella arboris]
MEKHFGQQVEYRVRKDGYSITNLARELYVNRRSVYNWFNQRYLKPEIIFRIGCVIRYDFSKDFPELFSTEEFGHIFSKRDTTVSYSGWDQEEELWQGKYLVLLEKYQELLESQPEKELHCVS